MKVTKVLFKQAFTAAEVRINGERTVAVVDAKHKDLQMTWSPEGLKLARGAKIVIVSPAQVEYVVSE